MRALFFILLDVLSGVREISELPDDKLVTWRTVNGEPVGRVSPRSCKILARLQTLWTMIEDNSQYPEWYITEEISNATEVNVTKLQADFLQNTEEKKLIIAMLKTLSATVVQSELSAECEHLSCFYVVMPDRTTVMRVKMPEIFGYSW
ncbi:hypothetical protein H6775_00860 [Candidatus Nomurabacteria bacterium]|nr:hypothetical protein [Candidatus Nomurabacteria bacterium]